MLAVYSIVKSTHLYFLAGNFLIWQASTPCRPPAGLLGALVACELSYPLYALHNKMGRVQAERHAAGTSNGLVGF